MIHVLKNTNLLDWFEKQTDTGIIHQCNCFHTMGSGIARQIAIRYPEAVEADKRTEYGSPNKVGDYSWTKVSFNSTNRIFNMYGQFTYGRGVKQTSYDGVAGGLKRIHNHAVTNGLRQLGLPYNMGSALGGGDWRIVRAIIDATFEADPDIDVYICEFTP